MEAPWWETERRRRSPSLTDGELLAILLSTGIKGKSAEKIAEEILERFGSLEGLATSKVSASCVGWYGRC